MIDPYIDPKTKILKNLLGITAEEVLTSLIYTDHVEIEGKATAIISNMNSIEWSSLSLNETAFKFGDLIAKLWLIHPFREGNTRTMMRFAGIFAASNSFSLDSLVLYNVPEKPEKNYFLKILKDSINNY